MRQYINMILTSDSVTSDLLMPIPYHNCFWCTHVRPRLGKSLYVNVKMWVNFNIFTKFEMWGNWRDFQIFFSAHRSSVSSSINIFDPPHCNFVFSARVSSTTVLDFWQRDTGYFSRPISGEGKTVLPPNYVSSLHKAKPFRVNLFLI